MADGTFPGINLALDAHSIDVHIGRRLRRRRRIVGMSQEELGRRCGVAFQQIQKYECAANRINAGRLWQIAAALEVPIAYFFEGLARLPEEERRDSLLASEETRELLTSYYQLSERTRRRLLDLAKSMGGTDEP